MQVTELSIPGVKVLTIRRHGDHRGFFSETYNARAFAEAGVPQTFVQDNHSLSREKHTIRGLHLQLDPMAQGKLIRVPRGRIMDVAVDVRFGSPTFGKHVVAEISAEAWNAMYVPAGFAHGFCTLEADTEVVYKVTNYYSPQHERGIMWNDPALGVPWPTREPELSAKDRTYPMLADAPTFFTYAPEAR